MAQVQQRAPPPPTENWHNFAVVVLHQTTMTHWALRFLTRWLIKHHVKHHTVYLNKSLYCWVQTSLYPILSRLKEDWTTQPGLTLTTEQKEEKSSKLKLKECWCGPHDKWQVCYRKLLPGLLHPQSFLHGSTDNRQPNIQDCLLVYFTEKSWSSIECPRFS